MKTKFLFVALLFSATATAHEVNDTIILKSGKTVIVNENKDDIDVSLIDADGKQLNQVYERTTTDEKEVEYYISSPFFPTSKEARKNMDFYNMSAGLFFATTSLRDGTFGNSIDFTRDSKSWEWGLGLGTFFHSFKGISGVGLTADIQLLNVHHHFSKERILTSREEVVSLRNPGTELRKSYMSYWALHIPVMFEKQQVWGSTRVHLALGGYAEWRFAEASRYFEKGNKTTETHDLNMNPIGFGLEGRIGLEYFQIYAKVALTSLLKTKNPDWVKGFYPVTIGIGF